MAMDIVKRTIEILAKGTVQSAKEPFTNVTRLKEDAVKIRDEVAKGYGSVKDTYQSMRSGGGLLKKVTEWFYQKGEQYGSDFDDDDFDAGFDAGDRPDEESHGQILDADAMKDIAKSQVGAMYRIGGKQVEASMMNTAEIITSVNARTTEITAAVNNLNKSLVDISKKLDTISQVIAYKQQREEKEYAQTILDSSGRFSMANIFSKSGSAVKGSMPVQMAGMLLQIAQQGGPVDLASMLISSVFMDRKMGALGDRSFNEVAKNINEGIGTATDKIIGKILDNKAFQKIFGDLRVDREVGGDYSVTRDEYNRNRAIFDGITRKTIIDVIPGYLREITKALSGRDLSPDRQGNLSAKHTDYFKEDALKNFGFGYSDAYKDETKKAIKERAKAIVGKEYSDQEIRAAEADLIGAASAFFMMRGVVKIDPALVIQYKDQIYKITLRAIHNSGGSSLEDADWIILFDEILGQVMFDKDSLFGSSSNAFCTKIQQNINTYHQRAKAAGQDYVAGKKARRLNEDDFVEMLALYNQQYIGMGGKELTADAQRQLDEDRKRLQWMPAGKEKDDLRRKIEELNYQRSSSGMQGDLKREDKSVVSQLSKTPVETMSHIEDIGMCILRKMHDVINVRVVHWKPKKFYPKWRNQQPSGGGGEGGSESASDITPINFPGSGTNETITDIIKGVTSGISDALTGEGSTGRKSKLAQYLDNRAELRGTSGKSEKVIDAVGSGASAVGRAIKTRGASIRDGIGNFVDATIDDVKGMAGGYLDRRIEEQEKRKASISRASTIREKLDANQTISDADKIAADTALSQMQAALQDGDGSKERSKILRQVDKIKNEELKNNLKESITSMLDVQSTKESAPAKTKLGKILKWAFTGLGVVFAPIIKAVKTVGSVIAKGFKFIGKFFTTLLKQGVGYAKKFGSATWDLTKLAGSKISGAVKSVKNAVFGSKQDQAQQGTTGAPGEETDYSKNYGDQSGQSKPGFFSSVASKTKGAFSGAADKLKNSKFMQTDFMKEFVAAVKPGLEKEKTPEEKIDETLKSEDPKGIFKTIVDEIKNVATVVKEKETPDTVKDSSGDTTNVKSLLESDNTASENSDSFSTKDFTSSTSSSGGNVLGSSNSIMSNFSGSTSANGGVVQGLANTANSAGGLKGLLGNIGSSIKGGASGILSAVTGGGGGTGLMGILGKMAGSLAGIFGVATIAGVGIKVLMKIGTEIMAIGIKPLKKALSKFWKALKPFIKTVGEAVATIVEPFAKVLGIIQELVVPILNTIGKAISKVVSWAMSFLGPLIETIGHTLSLTIGVIKYIAGYIVHGIGFIGDMIDAIRNSFIFGGSGDSSLGEDIHNIAKILLKEAGQQIGDAANSISAAWSGSNDDTTSSYDAVLRHSDTPNTNYGSAMEGLTGAGDTINYYYNSTYGSGNTTQYSYGGSMNMRDRGCGPVALADAYARRTGHGINAAALASAMNGSGNYDARRGTSVGGYLRTANSLGMGLTPGGVTVQSLRSASPNNPITVIGSGTGFGTRSGNNHYMNVIGTTSGGMAYVSNPMSGSITRVPTSTVAGNALLGLYGRGDSDDIATKYHFSDAVAEAFGTLKTIAGALLSPFTSLLNGDDVAEANNNKVSVLKNQLGSTKYSELEKAAKEEWQKANPRRDGESDTEYEKRWEKAKVAAIASYDADTVRKMLSERYSNAGVGEALDSIDWDSVNDKIDKMYEDAAETAAYNRQVGDATIGSYNATLGASSGTGAGVEDLVKAVATIFAATGAKTYSNGINGKYTTPGRGTKGVRTDCSGYISAGIEELGYTLKGASSNGSGLRSQQFASDNFAKSILGPDGQPSPDWISFRFGAYPLERGDITSKDGHVSMPLIRLTNPHPKGFDGGSTDGIKDSAAAARAYLAGQEYESLLHSAMGSKWWHGNTEINGATHVLRFLGSPPQEVNTVGIGTLGSNPTDAMIFSYLRGLGMSAVGAAGLMGCFKYESGMAANNLENSFQRDWGYPTGTAGDIQYTDDVNAGRESKDRFVNSRGTGRAGYGLAQFTSAALKDDLYARTVGRGHSIDDASSQLDVLAGHLKKFTWGNRTLWDRINNAVNAKKANEEFLWHYEAGTNFQSDADVLSRYKWMKQSHLDDRHNAATEYFNLYGTNNVNTSNLTGTAEIEAEKSVSQNFNGNVDTLIPDGSTNGLSYHVYTAVNSNGEYLFKAYRQSEWNGTAWNEMTKHTTGKTITINGETYYAFGFNSSGPSKAAKRALNSTSKLQVVSKNTSSEVFGSGDVSSTATIIPNSVYTTTMNSGLFGSGDISTDTSTIIPDISSRTMSDYLFDSLGTDTKTTVNNITLVRDDGSSKREEMDAALRGTYNVRSESIEALLEDILTELRSRKSQSGPTPRANTTSPENLFDNGNVPVQIQRLTTG